ncbi:glycosyltransferase family 2 protein [Desulforhopalus singaporensis]|nr:galactosyltransferase-related protein [Desulforhopalus singaporensis]
MLEATPVKCPRKLLSIRIILIKKCGNYPEKWRLQALEKCSVSCGKIVSKSQDTIFWNRYQKDISDRREKAYVKSKILPFTTANLAFTRAHYTNVGGFSEKYKFYGFEDIDFFLCSKKSNATISYTPNAQVDHADNLSLKGICRKMYEAGKHSSLIFSNRHLDYYQKMSYGKIDVNTKTAIPVLATYSPKTQLFMRYQRLS